MADTDLLTKIPYSATPDTRVSAIIARAHALLSVAHELRDDQPQLASAANQLATDIMDDAEAVLAHFMDEAGLIAERVTPAPEAHPAPSDAELVKMAYESVC